VPESTLTIDELAAVSGTTSRRIRSFQTLGLLAHPEIRGRTGIYDEDHVRRLATISRLQADGFTLESISVLFELQRRGGTLSTLLGLDTQEDVTLGAAGEDAAELYGFAELQPASTTGAPSRGPLLSIVPTTVWDESEAS
jgi:DNA-binding transcriptional MerR regulator